MVTDAVSCGATDGAGLNTKHVIIHTCTFTTSCTTSCYSFDTIQLSTVPLYIVSAVCVTTGDRREMLNTLNFGLPVPSALLLSSKACSNDSSIAILEETCASRARLHIPGGGTGTHKGRGGEGEEMAHVHTGREVQVHAVAALPTLSGRPCRTHLSLYVTAACCRRFFMVVNRRSSLVCNRCSNPRCTVRFPEYSITLMKARTSQTTSSFG